MQIKTAHKILIASAIVFFIYFGIWQFREYARTGGAWTLLSGLVSVLVAFGFGIYFRSIKWKQF